MRIGFLSNYDPANANEHSGIPFNMRCQLEAMGTVTVFGPVLQSGSRRSVSLLRDFGMRRAPGAWRLLKRIRRRFNDEFDPARSDAVRERMFARARAISSALRDQIAGADVDFVVTCFGSELLVEMDIDAPILYYTDTTAREMASYAKRSERAEGYREAFETFEQTALDRAAAAIFATELARTSAVNNYGFPAERSYVVPMGANVVAGHDVRPKTGDALPSRERLRLCITAGNPARKGLDLAIDTVEALRAHGWAAELAFVGPPTPRAKQAKHVRCVGRLRLSDVADRRLHEEVLRESHLMILPSQAEAFGIAPAEAGQQGTPSIVRGAGGLREVVVNGETGIVMPEDAGPEAYADRIEALADAPATYEAMSAAALERSRTMLTWDHWGDRIREIAERTLSDGAAPESPHSVRT